MIRSRCVNTLTTSPIRTLAGNLFIIQCIKIDWSSSQNRNDEDDDDGGGDDDNGDDDDDDDDYDNDHDHSDDDDVQDDHDGDGNDDSHDDDDDNDDDDDDDDDCDDDSFLCLGVLHQGVAKPNQLGTSAGWASTDLVDNAPLIAHVSVPFASKISSSTTQTPTARAHVPPIFASHLHDMA